MKIGVSSYSFSKYRKANGCSYIEMCHKAKEIGFEAIEFINLDSPDPMTEAEKIRQECTAIGLEISAYTVGADLFRENYEETKKNLYACIDVAAALGAPLLRHDVCYSLPEGVDWRDAVDVMVPRIREITAYAAERGIRTCSENHGYIFQDSIRVKTLIDAVDSENYRWLVDIGNFLCVDENPLAAVRVAAPYAIHVHAKDFLYKMKKEQPAPEGFFGTRNGNFLRGTVVGHGAVPVAACVNLLRESGYHATLSLEFEGMEENIPALEAGCRYLHALVSD